MNCEECRKRFIDHLDDGGEGPRPEEAQEHLAECTDCRQRLDALRAAGKAFSGAVSRLAPKKRYLTTARMERLERALGASPRPAPILTLRRFVGAAAAAVILVCSVFLYHDISTWNSFPQGSGGPLASGGHADEVQPVQYELTPGSSVDRVEVVEGYIRREPHQDTPRSEASMRPRMVLSRSPGFYVPVHNALDDEQEDGYWW